MSNLADFELIIPVVPQKKIAPSEGIVSEITPWIVREIKVMVSATHSTFQGSENELVGGSWSR